MGLKSILITAFGFLFGIAFLGVIAFHLWDLAEFVWHDREAKKQLALWAFGFLAFGGYMIFKDRQW